MYDNRTCDANLIDVNTATQEEIDTLPEFIKDKTKSSEEYDKRFRQQERASDVTSEDVSDNATSRNGDIPIPGCASVRQFNAGPTLPDGLRGFGRRCEDNALVFSTVRNEFLNIPVAFESTSSHSHITSTRQPSLASSS
jgi:hypothetical protein